jgi:thioesterase domain-containing protein
VSEINREFSKQLPLELLYEEGTIESLAMWLRSNKIYSSGRVLMPLYRKGDSSPLFLVHPLSGSAMCYTALSRALKYPLYGLQAASLETDILPLNNVEKIASTYLQAFLSVYHGGPILLGGWSFGGVVAFEMARQLENLGHVVSGIILFDSAAPGKTQKSLDLHAILKLCLEEITEQFGIKIDLSLDDFKKMNSECLLSTVLDQVKSCGAYPPDTDITALEKLVQVCLANAHAIDIYVPSSIVQCDMVLFRAADYSRLEEMLCEPTEVQQSCLGWSSMTSKTISVVETQGHHMSMLFQPNLESLIPKVREHIELFLA